MNYQKVYTQIVNRAKCEHQERTQLKKSGQYYERHHITPKCLGGTNDKENLVLLTGREHFICHQLLHRAYPENIKLASAFWNMCNGRKYSTQSHRHVPSSRQYEEARAAHSNAMKLLLTGHPTPEHIKARRRSTKGRVGTWVGKKHSEESKAKMREAAKNRPRPSLETIQKRAQSNRGQKRSVETRANISAGSYWKNKHHSEESKEKIRKSLKMTRELKNTIFINDNS